MKVREIQLRNFKRFTETTITDVPEAARLVLLVGPNGCGKSSLIDAVHMWYRGHYGRSGNFDEFYHRKQIPGVVGGWPELVSVNFHDPQAVTEEQQRKAVYVRTAYRNDPEFQLDTLGRMHPAVHTPAGSIRAKLQPAHSRKDRVRSLSDSKSFRATTAREKIV